MKTSFFKELRMEKATSHECIGTYLIEGFNFEFGMKIFVRNIALCKTYTVQVTRDVFEDRLDELWKIFLDHRPVFMQIFELRKVSGTFYVLTDFNIEKPY